MRQIEKKTKSLEQEKSVKMVMLPTITAMNFSKVQVLY